MRRGLLTVLLVLLGAATALPQQAPAKEEPQAAAQPAAAGGPENLFVETGVGVMLPDGEDPTPLLYAGFNYGLPAMPDFKVGAQIGARGALRNEDPDWLAQAGFFQRGFDLFAGKGAWSVQAVYQNTWMKADLLSLKPTLGVELDPKNCVAVTGVWGMTEETVSRSAGCKTVQQPVDTAMLLWGTAWTDELRTELGAGYEFQDVDSILIGAHGGYQLDDMTSINVTYAFDFDDDYYAAVAVAFDLGRKGRNATFNNVTGDDYTPFPMGSLPVVFYQTVGVERPVGGEAPPPEE